MAKLNMKKVREQTTPFDASEYLDDSGSQAELLSDALASGKARVIAHALGMIARARGMSDLARTTGLSRSSLYAALKEEGNPSLDTVMKVIAALELELRADAKDAAA
jgi:probable addiction module antidote protein